MTAATCAQCGGAYSLPRLGEPSNLCNPCIRASRFYTLEECPFCDSRGRVLGSGYEYGQRLVTSRCFHERGPDPGSFV